MKNYDECGNEIDTVLACPAEDCEGILIIGSNSVAEALGKPMTEDMMLIGECNECGELWQVCWTFKEEDSDAGITTKH
jgi:hypothetical protein